MDDWTANITDQRAYSQIRQGQILLNMSKALNDRHNDVIALYDRTHMKEPRLCAVIRTNDLVAVGFPRKIVNRMINTAELQAPLPEVFENFSKDVPPVLARLTVANLDSTRPDLPIVDDGVIIEEEDSKNIFESNEGRITFSETKKEEISRR